GQRGSFVSPPRGPAGGEGAGGGGGGGGGGGASRPPPPPPKKRGGDKHPPRALPAGPTPPPPLRGRGPHHWAASASGHPACLRSRSSRRRPAVPGHEADQGSHPGGPAQRAGRPSRGPRPAAGRVRTDLPGGRARPFQAPDPPRPEAGERDGGRF